MIPLLASASILPSALRPSNAAAGRTDSSNPNTHLAGRTVLVVDDDDALRALAALMLRSRGWKTFLACNGLEALQTLERSPHIDAVLLDLRMPVMSGEEAFRVMRETWPDIAVVVTSGLSLEEVTAHLGNSRPDGVVQKPFSLDNLTGALLRAL